MKAYWDRERQGIVLGKNNKRYDYEVVKRDFENKNYTLVSTEYKNKNEKLDYICNKHKDLGIQRVSYASLKLNLCNCRSCIKENSLGKPHNYPSFKKNYDKYFEKYKNKLFDTVQDEYTLEYVESNNGRTILHLIHNTCKNPYVVEQNKFFTGNYRCQNKDCKGKRISDRCLKTTEQFKKEVFDLVGDEYVVESEYIGKDNNIVFRHIECNSTFEKTPHNFLAGQRCPHCILPTKGEQRIIDYLENNDIKYTFQKTYNDLRGINDGLLSYDIHLHDYNYLIEYQGHFHDGTAFKENYEKFEIQQEHDRRKREYAKQHNINLLEIWYWDFDNIEKILEETLGGFKSVA